MGLDKNLLFTDQYIEIQLTSIKENRKKQIATSSYSILIEQQNSMFRKKIKNIICFLSMIHSDGILSIFR